MNIKYVSCSIGYEVYVPTEYDIRLTGDVEEINRYVHSNLSNEILH